MLLQAFAWDQIDLLRGSLLHAGLRHQPLYYPTVMLLDVYQYRASPPAQTREDEGWRDMRIIRLLVIMYFHSVCCVIERGGFGREKIQGE